MAVLRYVHGVREVVVSRRQLAVKDFATHYVVFGVSLAVSPRHRAVVVLLKAHHDARAKRLFEVVNFTRLQIPANFALGVKDKVVRAVVPLDRAACRVVPHDFGALAGFIYEVIYVVKAVGKFRARSLYDFDFVKQRALLRRHARAL